MSDFNKHLAALCLKAILSKSIEKTWKTVIGLIRISGNRILIILVEKLKFEMGHVPDKWVCLDLVILYMFEVKKKTTLY